MHFELQPTDLANDLIKLVPLTANDFEKLYKIASDPLVWEQHPSKTRYKREVFENYFAGAMQSGGAFLIYDAETGEPIGSSRFYDHNPINSVIEIGYTFIARDHWGGIYNRAIKTVMLTHAFKFVDAVIFHVGAGNTRSQKAMEKLGAEKTGEVEIAYFGEPLRLNYIYHIYKKDWSLFPEAES